MNDDHQCLPERPQQRQEEVSALVRRLAEAEAALRAVVSSEVDAVIDPESARPILLRSAQESLSETEGRYRRLLSRMSAMVFEIDNDGTTLFVNEAILAITGYHPEELLGCNWWELFCPGPLAPQVPRLYAQLQGGDVTNYELIIQARNGTSITLDLNSANRYAPDGNLCTVLGFGIDITRRKQAEQALRESEARYRAISTLTSDYVYALHVHPDKTLTVEWMTDAFVRITGYTPETLERRGGWFTLIHPDDMNYAWQRLQTILSGEVDVSEFRIVTQTHEARWVRDYAHPTWDAAQGRVVHILGAVQDITARKQAEEALQLSQARFAGIIDVAEDAIISIDVNQRITLFNPGAERIFRYAAHEVIGQPIDILLPERFVNIHQRHVAAFVKAPSNARRMDDRRNLLGRRQDGTEFPLEAAIAQFTIGNERVITVVLHDVTAQREAQQTLHRTNEQLSSLVAELEQRNREMTILSEMGDMLQACTTIEEAYAVIARFARELFPEESGALCILRSSPNIAEAVVMWGDHLSTMSVFTPDDCWALRRGRIHLVDNLVTDLPCAHTDLTEPSSSLCVPMMAQGKSLGVLHLSRHPFSADLAPALRLRLIESRRQLAVTMAEHVALALSNLKLQETLRNQAIRDPLTGLYNRRYMEESLERELHRATRNRYPIGVIMVDIDHFKHFNDTFGHDAGDTLLRAVGTFLQNSVRAEDIACRYGGEEFALIMPEATEEVTAARAETIRVSIRRLTIEHLNQPLGPITISAGVAIMPSHDISVGAALRRADKALYQAKRAGRDRVVIDRSMPPGTTL